jgi:hypothetical protein
LLAAGFQPHTQEPDWEDIIYFLLDRDGPTTVPIAPTAADVVS